MGIGNFKSEDILNTLQHKRAVEQLRTLGNVWIGPDVALEKQVIVPPLLAIRHASIIVNKKDFPQ